MGGNWQSRCLRGREGGLGKCGKPELQRLPEADLVGGEVEEEKSGGGEVRRVSGWLLQGGIKFRDVVEA